MTIIHHVGACGLPHPDSYQTVWHISWPEDQAVPQTTIVELARRLGLDVLYPFFKGNVLLVLSRDDSSPTETEVRQAACEVQADISEWTFLTGHVLFNPLRRHLGMND